MSKQYGSAEVLRRLERTGFARVSQRGSHIKLRARRGTATRTVIVKHPDPDIPPGTFRSILRQAGLTMEEFERL